MAGNQDQPEGLKIVNRYNIILYDAAWIAGVDFEDEEYDSDYSSDEEPSDDEDNDVDQEQYDPVNKDYKELEDDYLDEDEDEDDSEDFIDQEWQNWDNNEDELIPNPGNVEEDQDLDLEEEEELQSQPPPPAQEQEPPAATTAQDPVQPVAPTTRSGRVTRPPTWHNEYQSHMQTQAHPDSMTME